MGLVQHDDAARQSWIGRLMEWTPAPDAIATRYRWF